jgi:hypothetical protein
LSYATTHPAFRYFIEALFRVSDIPDTGVLFVAIGATVGQLIMGAVALATLRTVAPGVARGLSRPLFEGFGASILGGAAAYLALTLMGNIAPLTGLVTVFLQGGVAGIVGIAVSALILWLLGNQEVKDFYDAFTRLRSAKVLPAFDTPTGETT